MRKVLECPMHTMPRLRPHCQILSWASHLSAMRQKSPHQAMRESPISRTAYMYTLWRDSYAKLQRMPVAPGISAMGNRYSEDTSGYSE